MNASSFFFGEFRRKDQVILDRVLFEVCEKFLEEFVVKCVTRLCT